ncbi:MULTISPECIES: bacterio-opsin activator domain-containing protein [unclassified Haladaptatus]|uniref:bacterio-opsin activator domain-containing protein n=1 Tax=unclassified Haladaptatus TaxID=2622732 RepID=UPI0023E8680E|nr:MULTISPECIES: bacterio-opsin activator domain-containing protein [unclassified Haladaptatus]
MAASPNRLRSPHLLLVGEIEWVSSFASWLERHSDATVSNVPDATGALDALEDSTVDCLLCEHALEAESGLALLREIRERTATLPVFLCTADGSESLASEAIAAGVTEYVPLDGDVSERFDDLVARIEGRIREARRTVTQRDRARQFDAIFHDDRTATWVLDTEGAVVRANETARATTDQPVSELVGQPFWSLAWWADDATTRADVEQIVETAREGTFSNAVITRTTATDESVVDLSARPVFSARGDLASIVVEGVDISERVGLERDLRRSEELHRVTLNNMTDTVLMTDENGEYTYVCPNVHFIFGYTDDEIRELGTIDDLLGADLFDREELAAEGVLKNIECTASDKRGREHTLLVNVREVSIQDGTILYSCRDITKRKQREEALATLQELARDFLYAETHHEIAHHVVEDTAGVLDMDASAVYLFDAVETELTPIAFADSLERLHGTLTSVGADGSGLVSYSFLEAESLFFDDVHDADALENPATELRSAAYIPLGDHGVFFCGSPTVGRFDAVTRELADLLAATAEAALDRVSRESRLREQDRELQRRNSQLTALNRINEIIREIDQALVQAETRAEIDHAVCDLLTAADRFSFAWIGVADSITDTLEPRAWAGAEQGYLDSVPFSVTDASVEPAGRTAATREVTMVRNVADRLRAEPWRKEALSREYLSVISVPLAYDEFTYGVLTVYATSQNAFDETSQAVLAELGETIASATSAIERKNALLTTSVTRLEFDVADPSFVLSRLARDVGCTITFQGGVQQTDAGAYVFVTVEGADVEAVEAAANRLVAIDDVQRISASGSEGVLRLRLSQPFLALELADHGAVLRSASSSPEAANVVIDVPDSVDVRHITSLVADSFATIELRSKKTVAREDTQNLYAKFLGQLTDRQLEVIQTAYYSGFFESPRERTGEEIAATLGISPPAFYKHARVVQRKLFTTLFEDIGVPTAPST